MMVRHIAEGVGRVRTHIHAIGKDRINMVAIICCNRNCLSFTIFHNGSFRYDATASTSSRYDFITVAGENRLHRMIIHHPFKSVGQQGCLNRIDIYNDGADGITLIGFKVEGEIRTASHGGGHIRGDTSAHADQWC